MTNTRFLKTLVAAALAAVVVTGCQGIPARGPVQQGLSDLSQAQQQVQYRPDEPMPDASREEIVRGFLQAASSATDDYAIARQYLTQEYETQWDPYQSVLVDEGARPYREPNESTAVLALSAIATIDERGILTQIAPGEDTEVSFELEEEEGQWRISSAPNGVILDRTTFLDVWSQHHLFFGTTGDLLVPDARWFLNRATLSTHIVKELLAGPAPGLEGVARSGFIQGTALESDAVLIDAGTARIELTHGFENLPPSSVALAEQQLGMSLNAVPGVTGFIVTVAQQEVMSGSILAPQSLDSPETLESNYRAALLQNGTFGYIGNDGFQAASAMNERMSPLTAIAVTMDALSQNAAVLTDEGVWWVTANDAVLIDERRGLLAPSIDRHGYVWTATKANPGTISVQRPGDMPYTVDVPWLKGLAVTAMRVSPGGNMFAALIDTDRGAHVLISGITRETTGIPTGIVDPGENVAFWVTGDPLDLDWVDAVRVVALSRTDPMTTKLTIGGLGLFAEERTGVSGAVAVRGGGRTALMQLITSEGELWAPQGTTGWQRQLSDVDILSKRG